MLWNTVHEFQTFYEMDGYLQRLNLTKTKTGRYSKCECQMKTYSIIKE